MIRKIVKIDEAKCNGCGECVGACVEGAIQLIDGKARLVSDSYCDGLGACLGTCPQDAITVEEREAPVFDEAAALAFAAAHGGAPADAHPPAPHKHDAHGAGFACPGTLARQMKRSAAPSSSACVATEEESSESDLTHWPVQLHLVSPKTPAFQNADLLLAADCVPFAFPDFHRRLLRGRAVAIGCPKLDDSAYYVEKLTEILKQSSVKSLTVVHMEVPCCSGLTRIARAALERSGKTIPLHDVTISIDGKVLQE